MGEQRCFDVLELEALADLEAQPQDADVAIGAHQTDEGNPSASSGQALTNRDWQWLAVQIAIGWQLAQLLASPKLGGRSLTKSHMHMLLIDRGHQTPDVTWAAAKVGTNR